MSGQAVIILLLSTILAAPGTTETDIQHSKQTVSAQSNKPLVPLDRLLPTSDTKVNADGPEPAVPLKHVPKGTNLETGHKDAIR